MKKRKIFLTLLMISNFIPILGSEEVTKYNFLRDQKTYIKNPFELRDPFKRPIRTSDKRKKKRFGGFVDGNVFSNLPSIEDISIDKIKIVGVFLGKDRRALAKVDGDPQVHILKEGMKIGADESELKAILPGGIVLVEKIRNVYDQDEYLETVIPVTIE
jgi:Tfp pilus assembly protein PilP